MRLRRITARRSSVHGKGLFALQQIAPGERLIEYKGEVTSWRRAAARQRVGGRPYIRSVCLTVASSMAVAAGTAPVS